MDVEIELHFLEQRLRILSISKEAIKEFMYPIVKIAFTNKTKCKFFSFSETNDDYTIIVDHIGFSELEDYANKHQDEVFLSKENWIPIYLSGNDLPDSVTLSKIAKYVIMPLADKHISIMAISTYQCDYILVQEKDYTNVIECLSLHIPSIYDDSINGGHKNICERSNYNNNKSITPTYHPITLPLIIPDTPFSQYCITGMYNINTFEIMIPTLIDIMFYETESYGDEEIFFNFTRNKTNISIVMQSRFVKDFPLDTIQNTRDNEFWALIRIGDHSLDLECHGVCAQISEPLGLASIDEYYISAFHSGYSFVPYNKIEIAKKHFINSDAKISNKIEYPRENVFKNKLKLSDSDKLCSPEIK